MRSMNNSGMHIPIETGPDFYLTSHCFEPDPFPICHPEPGCCFRMNIQLGIRGFLS